MTDSEYEIIHKLQQENKRLQNELKQRIIKQDEQQQEIKRLQDTAGLESNMWSSLENMYRLNRTPYAQILHRYEMLDDIIVDLSMLHDTTSCSKEEFAYILKLFDALRIKTAGAPLFRGDTKTSEDPGNRCSLYPRHVLLLALARKRGNPTEGLLGAFFGIDQSTVSRYLKFADELLAKILPTGRNISKMIRDAKTVEEFKEIVPGKNGGDILIDGTHVPIQRPEDSEDRNRTYSGKKKRHTYNTPIFTNKDGIIIGIGKTSEGSKHDFTALKEDPLPFGRWGKRMKKYDLTEKEKIRTHTDLGYLGIPKLFPGTKSIQSHKKPKGGQLTKKQKAENRRINKERVKIEHSIGRLKQFARLTEPYDKGKDDLNDELDVISGIANLHMIWKKKKYRHLLN